MRRFILLIGISIVCLSQGHSQSSGEPSYVQSIYFGGGSFYVSKRQSEMLHQLLDSIPNVHNFVITVHSHTDDIGGKEYNEWLSEMRSDSVIEELILNEKVKKEVIEKRDFGLFNPIYDNRTWEGRRRNRRVDIIFWLAI